MSKKLQVLVWIVSAIIVIIFAIFGEAGDLTDTVWGATEHYTFGECKCNHHLYLLKNAEVELKRSEEREKAHKEEIQKQRKRDVTVRKEREAEIAYMAKVVYAESWIEGPMGWRLVADVLLNRIDSNRFPNDIYSVVSQRNQFQTYRNGAIASAPVKQEIIDVIREEMAARTNREILFFTAGGYNPYCVPMFRYKHHYFGR